MVDKNMETKY